MFLPAQVQVTQAVVEPQAFSQPLHPGVGHPHLPQVELHQAAVHRQHLRGVHRPLRLRQTESFRLESYTCLLMVLILTFISNVILLLFCLCNTPVRCSVWLYLVAKEQRPADIDRAKSLVAFQHDGKRYHALSGLQGQRQRQRHWLLIVSLPD